MLDCITIGPLIIHPFYGMATSDYSSFCHNTVLRLCMTILKHCYVSLFSQLNYATVEVTPVSGRTTPVQQYPPIEYSTVVNTFKF